MVTITLPPPARSPRPVHEPLGPRSSLYRIVPARRHYDPHAFRDFGPLARFDHHDEALAVRRAVLYAAPSISSCLVERFGESRVIEDPAAWEVARLGVERQVTLLDLRGQGAMRAGTVAAIAGAADRPLSQAWSRYFYEHPEIYGEIDGLLYANAHNGEDAVALYERCEDRIACPPGGVQSLAEPGVLDVVQTACEENGLIVGPSGGA